MVIIIFFQKIKLILLHIIAFSYAKFLKINLGKNVKFKNLPTLYIHKNAKVSIGKNTTINSSNFGYHLNMFKRCKIMADRENAIIIIGENCRIHGTCIHASGKIKIGNNCLIAANTNIIDSNGHLLSFDNPRNRINTIDNAKPIIIEDDVWIGANCLILGGVTIGKGSIVAANSVIKNDVPPMTIVSGNPSRILKQYKNENSHII